MSGPWETFAAPAPAATPAAPPPAAPSPAASGGGGPWETFSPPAGDDEPYTPTGAGAIPRGIKPSTPAPLNDMQERVARMKAQPPGTGDKIMGAVEAGLNLVTSITNFPLGVASGLARNVTKMAGQGAGAVATAIDRRSRGVPMSQPGDPRIGDDLENPLTGQDMQAVTYQPKTDTGVENVENYIAPVMNALGPTIGHGHEIAHAAPAVAPAARAAGDAARPVVRAAGEAAAKGTAKMIGVDPELAKTAQLAGSLKHPIDVRPDQVVKNAKFTKLAGQAAGDVPLAGSKTKSNQVAFTRNAIDLINPEETADRLTPETFSKAMDRSGSGIGDIMARTDVPLDSALRNGIDELRRDVTAKGTDADAKIVNAYLDELHGKADDTGVISGPALRELNSEIGLRARQNVGNDLGTRLNDLQGAIEDAVQRNVAPEDGAALKDFRRQYAYGKILEPTVAKTIDGVLPPSQLMGAVTRTSLGKHLMANAKGGPIGDLAKVGQLIKEPGSSGTAERSLIYGAGLGGGAYVEPHTAAAAYGAANLYNRAGPKLTRAMVGKKAQAEPPPRAAPPEDPTTSPGAGGPPRDGGGGGGPGPLGDLTPDWTTTPGAGGGGPRPGGVEPTGLHRAIDEPPVTTGNRKAKLEVPPVPGRPDLPDTMVSGGPAETAASGRANAAMAEPGAIEARRQQAPKPPEMPEASPVLTETQRLAAEHQSPAVRRAIQEHESAIKAEDAKKAAAVVREHDALALERAARDTTDPALQARLLKQADKLRDVEPIPVGKVTEGEPRAKAAAEPKDIPVGETTELTPEYIEADRSWRAEHKLGAEDAQRARDVAAALEHDEVGVHRAVRQFENQPRAFDREIARITEEGEARANESKLAAASRDVDAEAARPSVRDAEGPEAIQRGSDADAVPARGSEAGRDAQPEPAAAVRAAEQQPGADRVPAAGRGAGAGAEPAGRQAPDGAQGKPGLEVREVQGGFEAYRDGKKVGYLRDNLERGQAEQLGENANVDMVKVDKAEQGKGTGRALYKAFDEKHGGRIMPSGKTEPSAWALWKRNYPEKVDAFVKQEAARIRDGGDAKLVAGNITDAEVRSRVLREAEPEPTPPAPKTETDAERMQRIRDTAPRDRTDADLAFARGVDDAARQKAAADLKAADDAAVAKRTDTDGFTDGMSPLQRGKVDAALNVQQRFNGEIKTRKEMVRERVADGATVGTAEGQRALLSKDGSYLLEKQLSKLTLDYAEHLIDKDVPKVVRTTNEPAEGKVYHVRIGDDAREFPINRGDAGLGSPTWMLDTADHWKQGPAQSQNGYVSTYLGDTKAEALKNLPDVVKRLDASPGYAKEKIDARTQQFQPDDLQPKAGEKGLPKDGGGEEIFSLEKGFAKASDEVAGLKVRDSTPNMSSIASSLGDDHTVLPGVREVPFSAFTEKGDLSFYSKAEETRTRRLADEIKASGEINPLIVVMDEQGPYILEGGHRFDALRMLDKESFPAIVVRDGDAAMKMGGEGKRFLDSHEAIDRNLRDKFGEKLIDGLREQGVLKFAKNADEQPEGIRRGIKAIMRSPKDGQPAATLYYDRLTAENAPGVLMHELGEHFGIVRLLGPERYNMMLNDLRKLKNEPEVKAVWDKVADNYLDPRAKGAGGVSSIDDPRFMREVAAHLVETHPDLPFVRRLINEIRAFFFEKFGTTMGNRVDANLIRGLAASALRRASTGELPKMREYAPLVSPTPKPFVARR